MGDEAVKALQNSCMQKYPPKASAAELLMYKNRANRYSKCNVEQDHYKKHKFINLGWRNSYKTNEVISKLKNLKYDRSLGNVSFQNMNSFGISGVAVGFTVNKQCPQKTEDYQFSTYCTNNSSESGVAASAYGSLVCGQLPNEAKAMGFCAIGYSPIYDPYNESILDFLEKNSYCN
jgi:hypothetical protein